jgi:tetratricopeptide (TPR) repeat protein
MAEYHLLLLDWDQARTWIAEAFAHADKLGEFKSKARLLVLNSRTDKASGATKSVVWESLIEAEKIVNDLPVRREKLTILLDKTECLLSADELDEAGQVFDQIRLLPQFEGINTYQGRISYLHGLIDFHRDQYRRAITLFNDAYLASKTLQMPEMTWKALVALGETYQALTEYERAFKCYIEAFDILKRLASGIADPASKRCYLSDVAKIAVAEKLEEMSALVT